MDVPHKKVNEGNRSRFMFRLYLHLVFGFLSQQKTQTTLKSDSLFAISVIRRETSYKEKGKRVRNVPSAIAWY